ncbi:MAG: hypothetical protein GC164_16020 [Phycisphaera sp.]|nr:hypothetical protein [Phycisphaera sp.]
MRPPRNLNPFSIESAGQQKNDRRHGRLRAEMLTATGLGEVIDLSASGMRLEVVGKCRLEVENQIEMTLSSNDVKVHIKGLVRWVRKAGLRKSHVGIEFIDPSDEDRKNILALARVCMHNHVPAFDA